MNNPLTILSPEGKVLYTTPINSGCKRRISLMNEDCIIVKFSDMKKIDFPVGCHIDNFYITSFQDCKMNNLTGAYDYELRFDAYYYLWKNKLLRYSTPGIDEGAYETSFKLTAKLDIHASVILRSLNGFGATFGQLEFAYAISDTSLLEEAKYIDYNNLSLFDGLNAIAEAFECEWWVKNSVIFFGRCEEENGFDFTVGDNVESISSSTKTTQPNRLIIFGSERNLPSNYREVQNEDTINAVVNRRLQLPEGIPYLQTKDYIPSVEVVEEVVVFDKIYPKTSLTIEEVDSYTDITKGEDGEEYEQTFYRIKYGDKFLFSEDYILPDEDLHIVFESGLLNGMDFSLKFNPLGEPEKNIDGSWNLKAQCFEIVANEDYGRILPDNILYPQKSDKFIIYGWDATKMEDLGLVKQAENELLKEGEKLLEEYKKDFSTYTCVMMWDWCKKIQESFKTPQLGTPVLLHFNKGDEGRKSRIIGIEYDLDKEYSGVIYTCGESVSLSRLQNLEHKVEGLIQSTTAKEKENDLDYISKRFSDSTPFSLSIGGELASLSFLKGITDGRAWCIYKQNNQWVFECDGLILRGDAAINGNTTVRGLLEHPDFIQSVTNGKEWSIYKDRYGKWQFEIDGISVRAESVFNGNLSSPDFVSDFLAGKGWAITKETILNALGIEETKYTLEIDNLIVRGILRVFEMVISQLLGENDNRVFTAMLEVDHYDPETGRIWLDTQGGKMYNPFRKGDYIMVQQYNGMPSEENSYYITKHYELVITDAGIGNTADGEDRLDWVEFKNFTTPMEGLTPQELITRKDTLTRVDNESDPERKGIIQIITVGSKTPYLDVIYGLKTDPDNALKVRLGNLQGIRHHLFGWLQGWGLYSENCYLVGDFRLRNSGDSVEAEIQMLKDRFSSQYSEIEYEISDEDNLLYNPSFTENMEGWNVKENTVSVIWEDAGDGIEAFLMNGNLFAGDGDNAHWATLGIYDGRKMLHIFSSGISQGNATILQKIKDIGKTLTHIEYDTDTDTEGLISNTYDENGNVTKKADSSLADKKGREVPNTLYLSIKFKAITSGTLTIGFKGNGEKFGEYSSPMTHSVTASDEWQIIEWEGTWDGKGDFVLEYTGEMYIRLLSLTDDPLSDYRNEYGTLIEQTSRNIKLLAWNVNENRKEAGILIDGVKAEVRIWAAETKANGEDIAQLIIDTQSITARVESAEGNIGQLQITAKSIEQRVTDTEGNYASLLVTANSIKREVSDIQGNISQIIQTADRIEQRVTSAEGNISQISQTADDINLRVSGLQNNVASIDVRVTENSAQIEQKVSKNGVIAAINMSAEEENGSKIKIHADKVEIAGDLTINNVFEVTEEGQIILKGSMKQSATYGNNIMRYNVVHLIPSQGQGLFTLGTGEEYIGQSVWIYNPGIYNQGVSSRVFNNDGSSNNEDVKIYWISPGESIQMTCFEVNMSQGEWKITGRLGYQNKNTYGTQGRFPLLWAIGKVTLDYNLRVISVSGTRYDGKSLLSLMTAEKTSTGKFKLTFSNGTLPANYIIMCQANEMYAGDSRFDDASTSVSVVSKSATSIEFVCSDDGSTNDCSFEFMIFDTSNWYISSDN